MVVSEGDEIAWMFNLRAEGGSGAAVIQRIILKDGSHICACLNVFNHFRD